MSRAGAGNNARVAVGACALVSPCVWGRGGEGNWFGVHTIYGVIHTCYLNPGPTQGKQVTLQLITKLEKLQVRLGSRQTTEKGVLWLSLQALVHLPHNAEDCGRQNSREKH